MAFFFSSFYFSVWCSFNNLSIKPKGNNYTIKGENNNKSKVHMWTPAAVTTTTIGSKIAFYHDKSERKVSLIYIEITCLKLLCHYIYSCNLELFYSKGFYFCFQMIKYSFRCILDSILDNLCCCCCYLVIL